MSNESTDNWQQLCKFIGYALAGFVLTAIGMVKLIEVIL